MVEFYSENLHDSLFPGYGTEKERLYGKKVVICLTHLIKINYLTIIASLVHDLSLNGAKIYLLDIASHEIDSRFDKWGSTRKEILDIFYEHILNLNGDITLASYFVSSYSSLPALSNQKSIHSGKTLNDAIKSNALSSLEESAIRSFFATHDIRSLNGEIRLNHFSKSLLINIIKEMHFVSLAFSSLLNHFEAEFVLIQNGRWRSQSTIDSIARKRKINVMYFNSGPRISDTYFLTNYMIQDVVQHQKNFINRRARPLFDLEFKHNFVLDWANNIRSLSERFHAVPWPTNLEVYEELISSSKKTVTIFVSTPTEYDFFSGSNDSWPSQTDAIRTAAELLLKQGYNVVLRFHPNQQNYCFRDFFDFLVSTKGTYSHCIYPWDTLDSYELIKLSDLVIVWQSTIGLEAWISGKPVICLENTAYNLISQIPTANDRDSLRKLIAEPRKLSGVDEIFYTLHFLHFYGEALPFRINPNLASLKLHFDSFVDRRKNKSGGNRLFYLFRILYKASFFRNIGTLTMVEMYWLFSKFIGKKMSFGIIDRSLKLYMKKR